MHHACTQVRSRSLFDLQAHEYFGRENLRQTDEFDLWSIEQNHDVQRNFLLVHSTVPHFQDKMLLVRSVRPTPLVVQKILRFALKSEYRDTLSMSWISPVFSCITPFAGRTSCHSILVNDIWLLEFLAECHRGRLSAAFQTRFRTTKSLVNGRRKRSLQRNMM